MLEKKRRCNRSIGPYIQTEGYYVHKDGQTVYRQYQMTQTPSLYNPPVETTPPGTLSTDLLQPYLGFYYVMTTETHICIWSNTLLHYIGTIFDILLYQHKKLFNHYKESVNINLMWIPVSHCDFGHLEWGLVQTFGTICLCLRHLCWCLKSLVMPLLSIW